MKRVGNLFDQIVDLHNLRLAVARALRGKRNRPDARQFVSELEANLELLRAQLIAGTVPLGCYHQFVIRDPKERIITAPSFRERVLHHAVMSVCEQIFDRWLIDDTFACRRGRGRLAAVGRAMGFSRRYAFYLKLDVRKYFDSVSHERLLGRLSESFKDTRLLDLFSKIIRAFRPRLGLGLPIGSLTSQHFANFYLGWFDRYVKEHLRLKGYVRYMDDMILWSDSRQQLRELIRTSAKVIEANLELQLKPPYLNRTRHGVDFLGCRVYHNRVTLNRRSRRRFSQKLRHLERLYVAGELSEMELQQRATAMTAFTRTPDVECWQFRRHVLQRMPVSGHKARTG